MERRLSAIMAADMVGYSRLMEADEVGTLKRQKVHRRELIDPAFEKYHGRVVKEMGGATMAADMSPKIVPAMIALALDGLRRGGAAGSAGS